jgi:peptide/nickel transport system permease protein
MALGQRTDSASVAAVRKDLGLDKPLITQYIKYLDDISPVGIYNTSSNKSFFYLDKTIYNSSVKIVPLAKKYHIVLKTPYLRRSYQNQRDIGEMIASAFPATLYLAIVSIIFASLLGIAIGIVAALKKGSWVDRTLLVLTSLGMSLPSFFAAILIAWVFAYLLGNYTGLELTGSLYEIDDFGEGRHLMIKNLILPALTLGIRPLSVVTQLTRNTMLDVMSQDYIRTARAKGLPEHLVVWRHALRNALNPVITSISGWFASMMAGVIFIEYIFGWKGLGYVMVNALQSFDMPVVMGAVLVISFIFVIINIVTDITYSILDPRIGLE